MDGEQERLSYLEKIFDAIRKNAEAIARNEDTLTQLVERTNEFYKSLFSPKNKGGVFQQGLIDKNLARIPQLKQSPSLSSSQPATSGPVARRGLGKGSPGCSRKAKVCKRQMKNRETPAFLARKRKAAQASTTSGPSTSTSLARPETQTTTTSQQPVVHVEAELRCTLPTQARMPSFAAAATTTAETESDSPESDQSLNESDAPMEETSQTDKPAEERKKLGVQVQHEPAKSVTLIQTLAKARTDRAPRFKELDLFWVQMDAWDVLDPSIVEALKTVRAEWIAKCTAHPLYTNDPNFAKLLVRVHNTCNGVTNCVQHILGTMLKLFVEDRRDDATATALDHITDRIGELQDEEYTAALKACECESCNDVLQFDETYTRYHDAFERNETPEHTEEPMFANRPMHCASTEIRAQYIRRKFSGLSSSSLTKLFYLANSTPEFSPPAICLAPHTQVQEAVTRYMQPYLQERKLTDPLPSSWRTQSAARPNPDDLVEISKHHLHLYDGDSCEIHVPVSSQNSVLDELRTHGRHIRVRMPNHDAPETDSSVRIFKQAPDSDKMTPFITRHMGIESLRAARQAIFDAKAVFLQVNATKQLDIYRRLLADIWLLFHDDAEYHRLSLYLATAGLTFAFYTTGIDTCIMREMREASREKKGLFNLPEEIFCYPMRPWEIRRLQRDDVSAEERELLTQLRPICNVPDVPESTWRAREELSAAPVAIQDEHDMPNSQPDDQFYYRLVDCALHVESLCFCAQSTIANAGLGLFLKPRVATIAKGTHLCMYAARASTEEELSRSNSRMYVMETKSGTFDAEKPTGNNLGRYANQLGVTRALEDVKALSQRDQPQMTSDDWIKIERSLDSLANAEYKVVARQLVLVAKQDIPSSPMPTEIFTNYGGLRSYWINAERNHPGCFGGSISEIVRFLLHSQECNWSEQQRVDWSSR